MSRITILMLVSSAILWWIPCKGGELSELFVKLHPPGTPLELIDPTADDARAVSNSKPTGITEIAMERTGCYGPCPQYTVTFSSNGSVRYVGGDYAKPTGSHKGTIPEGKFENLARFIHDRRFFEMRDYYCYKNPIADLETVYTSVVADGKRKLIREYGGSGGCDLWVIQELIEKLLLETTWDEPKPKSIK